MSPSDDVRLRALAEHCLEVIGANQAPTGAYLASPSFPVYRYSWLRDGAFIADAMSRAGRVESADAFFRWCDRVIVARAGRIESLIERHAAGIPIAVPEFLPTRYTIDGAESGDDWTNFQLDGYGAWLWALVEHARRHERPLVALEGALLSARYITAFWDHPSYDWWEEYPDQRHCSTLAAIGGGLAALAAQTEVPASDRDTFTKVVTEIRACLVDEAAALRHLPKWLGGGAAVDASLVAVATPFDLLSPGDPIMAATLAHIERELVHDGGVHRYADDTYYGGGEWLLLAGLLGWHYSRLGRLGDARRELVWIADHATPGGDLPEQADEHLLAPVARDGWLRRWGPVATPLLWSHAMYLTLALELGVLESSAVPA